MGSVSWGVDPPEALRDAEEMQEPVAREQGYAWGVRGVYVGCTWGVRVRGRLERAAEVVAVQRREVI